MAASLYRVTSLFFLALALVALAVETAHGADKRGTREKVKLKDFFEGQEAKEKLKLKDYLEGQEADAKPPPQNASPLEVCILIEVDMYNKNRGRDSMSKVGGGLGIHKVGGYLHSF